MKLGKKLVIQNLGPVIVLGLVSLVLTMKIVNSGFEIQTNENLVMGMSNVQDIMDQRGKNAANMAAVIASRPEFIEAVSKKDSVLIQRLGKQFMEQSGLAVLTVADTEGIVLGRGHTDKKGDSVLKQENVKYALAGESTTIIEEGTVVKLSLRAGCPVTQNGKIIGSVTSGFDLTANDQFVNEIKRRFGIECTIFLNDTRVSTTLEKDGKRLIGTKMDNQKILATVLQEGKQFENINRIQNRNYNTIYWPLKGYQGKIIGMMFVGKDRHIIESTTFQIEAWVGSTVGIIALIACGLSWWFSRTIGQQISQTTRRIATCSATVDSVFGQITEASKSLADSSSQQAASLEETSSSLEEMSSMTKRNTESAQKANELAREARAAADSGASDMESMSRAMQAIKTSSDDIAKIIKTIDEIAFQTNILALNAVVEAARAGEAGMGFAVVAEEVRNLAQRSAQAARETADKIEGAIAKTTDGVRISDRVASGLHEIVNKVRLVDELVTEVATASKEQSQGIEQVNTAVSQMDKITQGSAASAEESASMSEELKAQAALLKEAVGQLLTVIGEHD